MTRCTILGLAMVACGWSQPPGGAELYRAGEFERARIVLEREVTAGTAEPETHFWLGYTHLALGARDRAVASFESTSSIPGTKTCCMRWRGPARNLPKSACSGFSAQSGIGALISDEGIRFELESS
ncbi:MAG: tetratricopeptide repeat protein [Bryobacteraceae bacterium]